MSKLLVAAFLAWLGAYLVRYVIRVVLKGATSPPEPRPSLETRLLHVRERLMDGKNKLKRGGGLFVVGLAMTVGSYISAVRLDDNLYILCWGAVGLGLIEIIAGTSDIVKGKREEKSLLEKPITSHRA